jgi:hypothetical protein
VARTEKCRTRAHAPCPPLQHTGDLLTIHGRSPRPSHDFCAL